MKVKILGTGCAKCNALEKRLQKLKEEHQLNFELQKITDLNSILSYGVMMTPGLIINEQLKSIGKVPASDELLKWLNE